MAAIWLMRLLAVFWAFLGLGALQESELADRWDRLCRIRFTIGKDTTFIEGPLRKDGVIDYEGAVNEPLTKTAPDSNAAVLLMNVRGPKGPLVDPPLLKKYYELLRTTPPNESAPIVDWSTDSAKELGDDVDDRFQKLWSEKSCPKLAATLKRHDRFLAAVVDASKRPKLEAPALDERDPPIMEDLKLIHLDPVRWGSQMLTLRALMKAEGGDLIGAYADLDACYRLGVLLTQGERFLMDALVALQVLGRAGYAEAIIADKKPHSAALHRERVRMLMGLKFGSFVESVSTRERYLALAFPYYHGTYWKEHPFKNNPSLPGLQYSHSRLLAALLIDGDELLRTVNGHYDRAAASYREPNVRLRAEKLEAFHDEIMRLKAKNTAQVKSRSPLFLLNHPKGVRAGVGQWLGEVSVLIYMPALNLLDNSHLKAMIQLRLPACAHALKAHKLERGAFPKSFDELAAELKPATIDPATDKPFKYSTYRKRAYFGSAGRDGKHQAYVGPRVNAMKFLFPKDKDPGDDWTFIIE